MGKRARRSTGRRILSVELLEFRRVWAALPYGAAPQDTGEFMLGSVAVTPVLLESNGQLDVNSENWTAAHIQQVLANVDEGLQWWVDTLAQQSPLAPLNFVVDTTYADSPVATKYEPISRRSNDYHLWTSDFLSTIGFPRTGSLEADMRAFNHAQRVKHETDWSFTIFVVPSQNDADGQFAAGGSFNRAFAFAGGLFMVVPSTRPASTYAHETGHMFWARDEYAGGGSYSDLRGYYNTQNLNAVNNPTPGFVQQPSIMASESLLDTAYANYISPPSTLAMLGWQDSDADGIFDVLDVPHRLSGAGYFEASSSTYHFRGSANVQTLPNRNSSGLRNDITINRIREIEVRFDDGPWQVIATPNAAVAPLDLSFAVPTTASQLELRARDSRTSVVSNMFQGRLSRADSTLSSGINGSVWTDANGNQLRDVGEIGASGWLVELIDGLGAPLATRKVIEPDQLPAGALPSAYSPDWQLTAVGSDTDGRVGIFSDDRGGSTGSFVFKPFSRSSSTFTTWNSLTRRLQVAFSAPTSHVQIDALGDFNGSYGRLEAYSADGQLLARYTTAFLAQGQPETMTIRRDVADIAYVIAGGHANRNVKLDNLQYGPRSVTTTGDFGTFAFPGLPSGTYRVRATPDGAYQAVSPESGIATVSVVAGGVTQDVDFGFAVGTSQWQNVVDPYDVNDDGLVSALDALLIINQINAGGARDLRGSGVPANPYVDVTGDYLLSALDVLQVVNFINARPAQGEGEAMLPGSTPPVPPPPLSAAPPPAAAPLVDQVWRKLAEDELLWVELSFLG